VTTWFPAFAGECDLYRYNLGSFKHAAPSLAAQPALRGLADADWRFEADLGVGPPPPPPIPTTTTHNNPAATTAAAAAASTTTFRGTTVLSRGKVLGGTAALVGLYKLNSVYP
jgi:hypothetical protein